ncbi:MAG: hypothetical protein M0R03_18770 [Novosphingobium sp.]|nr:hypothetical protein [Novosphingobium sp.]
MDNVIQTEVKSNLIMKYTEIFKLRKMLSESKIPFDFIDHNLIRPCQRYQICVPSSEPIQKRVISVIQGRGTYGGQDDLLEIRGLLTKDEEECDTVAGWLTAENVFARIKKYLKEK